MLENPPPAHGLYVFRSNRAEALAASLAEALRRDAPALDPMQRLDVAVDEPAAGAWLRDELGGRLGVVMNLDFPLLGSALERAVAEVSPRAPVEGADLADPWSKASLRWAVLESLPEVLAQRNTAFDTLRSYLCGTSATESASPAAAVDGRVWSLAGRIADLFDRYALHRPTWARAWTRGEPAQGLGEDGGDTRKVEAWQRALWSAIVARLGSGPSVAGRVELLGEAPSLLRPLRLFGLTSLSTVHLDWLRAIARRQRVELYVRAPSLHYFASRRQEQRETSAQVMPLLNLFADESQAFLEQLVEANVETHECFCPIGAPLTPFAPAPPTDAPIPQDAPTCVLHRVQADVVHAEPLPIDPRSDASRRVRPEDDSITIHACHGPVRQAEVLREALLHLLAAKQHLETRDVLVLTPDAETFVPLVEAAFAEGREDPSDKTGWGPSATPRLNLRVMGRSMRQTNPVADALARLLDLVGGRLPQSEVMALLQVEPVRRRFDLDEEAALGLQTLVAESGARWAVDAAHREACGQPADAQNTWAFALERLAAGLVYAEDVTLVALESEGSPVAPLPALVGERAAGLGGLFAYIDALMEAREVLAPNGEGTARPLAEWVELLIGRADDGETAGEGESGGVLATLTRTTGRRWWLTDEVQTTLRALVDESAECTRPLTLSALRLTLGGRFELPGKGVRGRDAEGGVTLAPIGKCVGLPFPVVVLLGFDQDTFPKMASPLAFDLTQRHPHPGDPNPRRAQRQDFLDALLQAGEHLLVFYSGRDPYNDKPLAPATPVAELRETLDATLFVDGDAGARPSEALTRVHPLQPFSERNFAPGEGNGGSLLQVAPWSFDPRILGAAQARQARLRRATGEAAAVEWVGIPAVTPDTVTAERIKISALGYALQKPARTWVRDVLDLNLETADDAQCLDREPILGLELEDKELWTLVLKGKGPGLALREPPPAALTLLPRLRAQGALSLGEVGKRAAEMAIEKYTHQHAKVLAEAGGVRERPAPVELELDLGPAAQRAALYETVGGWYGEKLIKPVFFLLSKRHLLGTAIQAAALAIEMEQGRVPGDGLTRPTQLVGISPPKVVEGEPTHNVESIDLRDWPTAALRAWVEDLVVIYRCARSRPIPLFDKASSEFVSAVSNKGARSLAPGPEGARRFHATTQEMHAALLEKAYTAAHRVYFPDDYRESGGDVDDPYIAHLFGHLKTLDPRDAPHARASDGCPIADDPDWTFPVLALRVYGPLFTQYAEGTGEVT